MLILLLMLPMSATVIALALTVTHDGYGSRPPLPRSHVRDSFDPHDQVR